MLKEMFILFHVRCADGVKLVGAVLCRTVVVRAYRPISVLRLNVVARD